MRAITDTDSVVIGLAASAAGGGPVPSGRHRVTVGGGSAIDCPGRHHRISTSDPAVVDTVGVSRREVLLQGKGYGQATVGVWSKAGRAGLL